MRYLSAIAALLCAAIALPAQAQPIAGTANHITADLVAEGQPQPGQTLTVALRFRPDDGWHGYWANPGDAGLGMQLDWQLPAGWQAGAPQYPVPVAFELFGFINHVYKQPYAVLVPIAVPEGAAAANLAPISLDARWLACSDSLCVTEGEQLTLRFPQETAALRAQFDAHRAAIPPLIDSVGRFALGDEVLRIAIPLPEGLALGAPHVFIEQGDVIDYAAPQNFYRNGNFVIAEIMRGGLREEPGELAGIVAFGAEGEGLRFAATPGDVPAGGRPLGGGGAASDTPIALLLGGALLGGLLLNLMPCVFPILSLKAMTLVRAGESEAQARREGLAYTLGVLVATIALGAAMLALRAAGEQVGWAFQLQQPLVVAALLVLAVLITANFAGLFELPSLPIRTGGPKTGGGGAFATGLLAAVVATPCTGPFMAAALGAALLLPAPQALLLFAMLGLGLALPFLLLGFIPALRSRLPRPGAWMETFRRIMAIPMGLTALALAWLAFRLGGLHFTFAALALAVLAIVALAGFRRGNALVGVVGLAVALYFAGSLPFRVEQRVNTAADSLIDPLPYSEMALTEARASGAPVFLWFTADWCITCKVNEQVAIERETTRAAFDAAGVVAMRGDWTRADPAITRYLEQWGVAGVPLYVWYPAREEGEQLPQILSPDMLAQRALRQ